MSQFKQRHPEVSTCIGRKIDPRRIHGTQSPIIYERLPAVYGILDENDWNMDEHGMGLGEVSSAFGLTVIQLTHIKWCIFNGIWMVEIGQGI